jgi:site-specific recombinase XerD
LTVRVTLAVGPLFCVLDGPTGGRVWSAGQARGELAHLAAKAGVRRRFAPHQLRHAHAIELTREGISLPLIQRQLGHAHLGVTSVYLRGIDRARSSTPSTLAAHRHPRQRRAEPVAMIKVGKGQHIA